MKLRHRFYLGLFFLFNLNLQIYLLQYQSVPALLAVFLIPLILTLVYHHYASVKEVKTLLNFYKLSLLLLGPFASGGAVLMIVISPKKQLIEAYREFITAEAVFSPSERMVLDLNIDYPDSGAFDITPYVDIMESDNSLMKRSTINKVVQHPGRNSRFILDIGLQDEDPDIRFYAASALIILNDSFIQEFRTLQKKISEQPHDPQLYLDLALAYDRYCTWNLPEVEDMTRFWDKIENAYTKTLKIAPNNITAISGLAGIYLKKKRYESAAILINKGMRRYPNSSELSFLFLKLLFIQKKFDQLRTKAKTFIRRFPNNRLEIQEVVSYWQTSVGD